MQTPSKEPIVLLPQTHHGAWKGPNRLWFTDPDKPMRSPGGAEVAANSIEYRWEYEGAAQSGRIDLVGQFRALEAKWQDTWHAPNGMVLHGESLDGRLTLFGTYSGGEYGVWGWRIELDTQDPERFSIRMHNVVPGVGLMPAVMLEGTR